MRQSDEHYQCLHTEQGIGGRDVQVRLELDSTLLYG